MHVGGVCVVGADGGGAEKLFVSGGGLAVKGRAVGC